MPETGEPGSPGRRIGHVVRADDERHVRPLELGVDVVHLLELRDTGTFASASRTFMCPGIRPATGWIA